MRSCPGRLHLGRIAGDGEVFIRPILAPIMLGLLLVGVFVLGSLVVREIDPLADYVSRVLEYADQGSLPLLAAITFVNGIAEELFFRGAMYAAIPRHPVLWTTIAYVVATLATGNVMLAFAAVLLGTVCGLERRASGGILAPILTHITWSLSMLFLLPAALLTALLGGRSGQRAAYGLARRSAAPRARRRGSRCRDDDLGATSSR